MEELIVDYFQNIAIKLKDLADKPEDRSFYFIKDFTDQSVVNNAIRNMHAGPILVLENPEGAVSNNSDNITDIKICAFAILIRESSGDEQDEFKPLYARAHAIAMKIYARMRRDLQKGVFDYYTEDFSYQKVGPVADGRYGRRYEFRMGHCIENAYNEEDWTE